MIKKIQFEEGKMFDLPLAVSQTITKGMGLIWASGYLSEAQADEEIFDFIAEEAITTDGSGHTKILCSRGSGSNIMYEVDTSANTAQSQCGVAYEASTSLVIDNEAAATANGFLMTETVGAAANKKARGFFL